MEQETLLCLEVPMTLLLNLKLLIEMRVLQKHLLKQLSIRQIMWHNILLFTIINLEILILMVLQAQASNIT